VIGAAVGVATRYRRGRGDQERSAYVAAFAFMRLLDRRLVTTSPFVEVGRLMLEMLLAYRTGIGQVLGIVACTATVICFEYFFEWTWFAAIPVGVLAYITMPILWANFIVSLDRRQPRS
jgi:hypothetical protein